MTKHFNKHREVQKRKFLRNHATKAERILWRYLKNSQLENTKFRRQYSIDQFVIDFYCPDIKLAIELDGSSHFSKDQFPYDIEREKYIKSFGIKIQRFTNEEIYTKLDLVLIQIANKINELKNLKNKTTSSP
jgi:very-short-patch-repair endonuclease